MCSLGQGEPPRCRRVALRPKLYATRIARKPKAYPEHPSTLAGHLLKRRSELALLQRQAASRLGIGHETYITWEKHNRPPTVMHWPKIINFLGYDPNPAPTNFSEKVLALRRRTGRTCADLARQLDVHECTVNSWERGRHPPDRSPQALHRLLALFDGP